MPYLEPEPIKRWSTADVPHAEPPDALFASSGPFFNARRAQLVNLASRHASPTIYSNRPRAKVGGLMSYGTDQLDWYRHAGIPVRLCPFGTGSRGRRRKAASSRAQSPPTFRLCSTKLELVINLKTAKVLGLTVPPSLLTRADEVIE